MVEYRKHKSGREFAKIKGDDCITVRHLYDRVDVILDQSGFLSNSILPDAELYKPCAAEEFTTQLQLAMERIQTLKIS